MPVHQLSDAQIERLVVLSEELAEAQQVIGKILRHGYESKYPMEDPNAVTNRGSLTTELGDVAALVSILVHSGDLFPGEISYRSRLKLQKISRWLHEPENITIVSQLNTQ